MKLILCGGGSGKQNKCSNEKLNEIIDHKKMILYVPLAMDENDHTPEECYEWIQKELSDVNHVGIDMVRSFEELADKNYSDYSCMFIGGGNTYKLLKGLKETACFEKINRFLADGGIITGGSAGASIFGKDIDVIKPMDDNYVNLKDTIGFDKFNGFSIFPHYPNCSYISPEENEMALKKYTEFLTRYTLEHEKVYAIPEEDAVYISDDGFEIIGPLPYYIFDKGVSVKKEIGE